MRIRLMKGSANMAEWDVRSAAELGERLSDLRVIPGTQPEVVGRLQVHLWHDHAWWNLSDDLEHFFTWIIETKSASITETRVFAANPLSRPDWLYEAAQQMKKLLEVATEVHPG